MGHELVEVDIPFDYYAYRRAGNGKIYNPDYGVSKTGALVQKMKLVRINKRSLEYMVVGGSGTVFECSESRGFCPTRMAAVTDALFRISKHFLDDDLSIEDARAIADRIAGELDKAASDEPLDERHLLWWTRTKSNNLMPSMGWEFHPQKMARSIAASGYVGPSRP